MMSHEEPFKSLSWLIIDESPWEVTSLQIKIEVLPWLLIMWSKKKLSDSFCWLIIMCYQVSQLDFLYMCQTPKAFHLINLSNSDLIMISQLKLQSVPPEKYCEKGEILNHTHDIINLISII